MVELSVNASVLETLKLINFYEMGCKFVENLRIYLFLLTSKQEYYFSLYSID